MRKEDVLRNEMMEQKKFIERAITQANSDRNKAGGIVKALKNKVVEILANSYIGKASKDEVDQHIMEYYKQKLIDEIGAEVVAKLKAKDNFSHIEHEIKRLTKVRNELKSLKHSIQYGAENKEKYKALEPYGRDAIREQIPNITYVTHLDQNIQTALDLARELGEEEIFNEWLKQVANPEG